MSIEFQPPLADANDFSSIRYAATPTFKLTDLVNFGPVDVDGLTFTYSGGTALFQAAQRLKVSNNVILVPSYHCPAAIEPFIYLDFECVFYRVQPDLSPDYQHITQLISQHNVTHCLIINYFGVISNIEVLAGVIANHNIDIIHDCAHALFGLLNYAKQPKYAQATICSINKILPSIDGGIVVFEQTTTKQLASVSTMTEFKALLYLLGITGVINKIRFMFTKPEIAEPSHQQQSDFRYFDSTKREQRCFSHTISLLRHSDLDTIVKQRRENYQYLCAALSDTAIGKPLVYQLTNDCVPYVLPFLLDDANDFNKLRKRGIQCLRWEEVAYSDCSVSQDYRSRLLQLPCHHQLTKQQLDQMIAKIKEPL